MDAGGSAGDAPRAGEEIGSCPPRPGGRPDGRGHSADFGRGAPGRRRCARQRGGPARLGEQGEVWVKPPSGPFETGRISRAVDRRRSRRQSTSAVSSKRPASSTSCSTSASSSTLVRPDRAARQQGAAQAPWLTRHARPVPRWGPPARTRSGREAQSGENTVWRGSPVPAGLVQWCAGGSRSDPPTRRGRRWSTCPRGWSAGSRVVEDARRAGARWSRFSAVLIDRIGPFELPADLDITVVDVDEGRRLAINVAGEDRQVDQRVTVAATLDVVPREAGAKRSPVVDRRKLRGHRARWRRWAPGRSGRRPTKVLDEFFDRAGESGSGSV